MKLIAGRLEFRTEDSFYFTVHLHKGGYSIGTNQESERLVGIQDEVERLLEFLGFEWEKKAENIPFEEFEEEELLEMARNWKRNWKRNISKGRK